MSGVDWKARAEAAEAEVEQARGEVEQVKATVRNALTALAERWEGEAGHGYEIGHTEAAHATRLCAIALRRAMSEGGCCGACGGDGYAGDGLCWDCQGTGHPHPEDDLFAALAAEPTPPAEPFTDFERMAVARLAETEPFRFCDDAGIITAGPGAGQGIRCTGSVHYGATEVPCGSPVHHEPTPPASPHAGDGA